MNTTPEPFGDRLDELGKCYFAGEVAISEMELEELGSVVARDLSRARQTEAVDGRLILLAVNCAYYRMDAEGFWAPFCKLLQPSKWQVNWLGTRIEQALINYGFRDRPYVEGFRFVTPVRLQAGLTLHDFPAFVRLLKEGKDRYGWSGMITMPHGDFTFLVDETLPSTKFTEFLKEREGGWALTQDVLKDLVRWEQGLSVDGKPSPHGYRPGFWDELLPLLELRPTSRSTVSSWAPRPKFIFDSERAQLGLLFPQDFVNRSCARLDGQTVCDSFLRFDELAKLQANYSIQMRTGVQGWQSVELPGWCPCAQKPFALFQLSGEYLAHGETISTGAYFLIALNQTDLPGGIECLTDFEYVDFTDTELRFWQIEIREDLDANALGYRLGLAQTSIIEWGQEGETMIGAADASQVYLSELPAILVRRVPDFEANRLALCYDDGKGITRLPVDGGSETALVRLPVKPPCRGRVWVEIFGRVRSSERFVDNILNFCLIPRCEIRWPQGLYSHEDEPSLSVEAEEGVECDFPKCEPVKGSDSAWKVPPNFDWIEGELTVGSVSLRLARRIFRASIEDESNLPLFIEKANLEHDARLCARGLPGTQVNLRLRTTEGTGVEVPLLQRFDRHGKVEIRRWDLRDALDKLRPTPVVAVDVWGGAWAATQARILDMSLIEAWLFSYERAANPEWLKWLKESDLILALVRSVNGMSGAFPWPLPAGVPKVLNDWITSIMACTWVLTLTSHRPASVFLQQALAAVAPSRRRSLEWALRAERSFGVGSDEARSLCAEYSEIEPLNFWIPWHRRLRDLHDQLALDIELTPMIEAWRDEVMSPCLPEPSSTLGLMQGGRQLSRAYSLQFKNRPEQAYRTLSEIPADASGIVADLRLLLDYLLRYNFGGGGKLPPQPSPVCHRRLLPLLVGLRILIAKKLGETPPPPIDIADSLPPDTLPLRIEDANTMRAALETQSLKKA